MAAVNFPNSPSVNDTHTSSGSTWKWDGGVWQRLGVAGPQGVQGAQGAQGAQGYQGVQGAPNNLTIATSPPGSPTAGDLWWDSDDGDLHTYFNDGNSSQWVNINNGPAGAQGAQGAQGRQGATGAQGHQGHQGVQGATGAQGHQGVQGAAGSNATISNNADNRVITGGSGTNLNGEDTLTYDGTSLLLNKIAGNIKVRSAAQNVYGQWYTGNAYTALGTESNDYLYFFTNGLANERVRIAPAGQVLIGETATSGMSAYDLGMKNNTAIRFRKADGSAWINSVGLDNSNNLKLGWGGSVDEIHFGISGIGEQAKFDSGGRLLIGYTASQAVYSTSALQVQGTTAATSSVSLLRHNGSPYLSLGATGGSSLGGVAAVSSGDRLGQLTFAGADGTDVNTHAASIAGYVDGSVSGNTVPGRLVFSTSTGAGEPERMRISSNGNLLLGTTTDTQRLHVYNGNGGTGYKTALFNSNDTSNGTRLVVANSGNTSGRGLGIMVGGSYAGTDKASLGWFNTDNTFTTASILTLTSTGQAYFPKTVGIQTNDVTRANLANPVGAGHSLVGMYIGDGSLLFNNTLNRTGGYYISTETNALNAGPVTLVSNMKVDGAWVIV